MKYAWIDAQRRDVGLDERCAVLDVSESGYRSWKQGYWRLELTLTEGRNREVRRICEALGLDVQRLVRQRFGPIELGKLPRGECRPLTKRELQLLQTV